MSVSQTCLDNSEATLIQLANNLRKKIKVMLLGGQNCCDTDRQDMMIYNSYYILNKYGNPNPSNEDIQESLNDKQVECICNWVALQNIGIGGGSQNGQYVTYDLPVPGQINLNLPTIFQAITGVINIITSRGDWYDEGFGANAIGYGGSVPRNFNINVSVSVSSVNPVFVEYSWQKSESGVMIYETTPQGSATTPGGGIPHAPVTFSAVWSPTQSNDLFSVQVRENVNPIETITLRSFSVSITEQ